MARAEIPGKVVRLAASNASDEAVLGEVVRLLCDANPSWEWVGVYLLAGDTLFVGPHAGEYPEHSRIAVGEGVCGTAVAEGLNQIAEDVRKCGNYLACSLSTRSEIVVLIRHEDRVVGEFDVDSDEEAAFSPMDEALLEEVADLVALRCATLAGKL